MTADLPEELRVERLGRIRRGRLRSWWLKNKLFVAVAGALIAFGLGVWGFARLGSDWADTLYDAAGFFRVTGPTEVEEPNVQLHIARVLAPLVVGFAAVLALLAVFREQAQLLRIRFFSQRHVIVVGLGTNGLRLATALHRARLRVVVVELDPTNAALAGCRARGIPVVVGDGCDKAVLELAGCERALHVVACTSTDASNLEVLTACSKVATGAPLTAHVLLETRALRERLQTQSIGAPGRRMLRADFAALSELSARALASAAARLWPGGPRSTIVVAALTATGRQVAIAAARASGERPRVVLVGPDAEADRAAILRDAPELTEIADADALPCDPLTGAAEAIPREADVAFVCHEDEAVGFAWAAAIAEHIRGPVLVDVADDAVLFSLGAVGIEIPGVHPVGSSQRVLGPSLLLDTANEAIARARHDAYLRLEHAAGRGGDPNPSLVPWDELPESLKESNRRFADSVGAKAQQLGGRIVPLPPGAAPLDRLGLPRALVEELARREHERWKDDLELDGWRPTDGPKDAEAKLHPLLVGWDELAEQERDKDRESIRELPRLLWAAGYGFDFSPAKSGWTDAGEAHMVATGRDP
jgi:hypothetical protein